MTELFQLCPQVTITHHGAKHTVTGSCHEVNVNGSSYLIDCGRFQGAESRPLDIEFSLEPIKALILSHAHIDHIGRIPWLLAKGFNQPIYSTKATHHLLPIMLDDGLAIEGVSQVNRQKVLTKLKSLCKPIPYAKWFTVNNIEVRFQPAGHILGSAYIEIKLPNKEVVVFSGDLGPNNTPLLADPIPPKRADYLFLESTYGNKTHQSITARKERLAEIIDRSLKDGGAILIPAFSVGRTQELLYDIETIIHEHSMPKTLPVIIDSPMANKITASYQEFKNLWSQEAKQKISTGRHPLAFDQCVTIDNHKQHQRIVNRLASTNEPAIVVAASGMCTGGRILNYLQALLPNPQTDVLFSGYQANGTLGSKLSTIPCQVEINQQLVPVRAHIHTLSGYSAHADKQDLLNFVANIQSPIKQLHLIHGVKEVKSTFKQELKKLHNVNQVIV